MQPRNLLQACFPLLVLYGASSVFGQDKVGIGVSFEPTRLFFVGEGVIPNLTTPVNVYIPINFATGHRLEPDFGFFSFSSKRSNGVTEQYDLTITRLGLGGFYLIPTNNTVTLYAGARVGLYFVSSKTSSSGQFSSSTTETRETDFTAGVIFGGEYFASSQFSFGAEAQANYVSFGRPVVTSTPPPPTSVSRDRSQHMVSTNALFFVRMYF